MSETIGFIGLGQLGLPVATNLLNAGYGLRVYNRTASKAAPLVAQGAQLVSQPAEVVNPGGIVITLLWGGESVESIVTSAGFLEQLGEGGIHISMSTIAPESARKLAALHARHGSTLVEAPIFGRPEAAVAKSLWIPMAGPQAAKERVKPVLEALGGRGIFDFGEEIGAANIVKLAGNFLIGSAARSLEEALAMAEKNGVNPQAVVDMLTQTLFTAPIYQSYGKMIAEKTPRFSQSAIPQKDTGLFIATAQQAGVATPISSLLLDILNNAQAKV